jgi:uncharacterized coiled-coil DUF342 family protein
MQQVDAENADLRVNVEKTTEKILSIQAQTAEQKELNEQLHRQVAEMKHSVDVAAETEETLRLTKLQIRGLEQELAQEKDNHEATQRQLQRQKAAVADLNEKIHHQSLEINQVHQQMKEVLDNRQLVQADFDTIGSDPLKRRVMEMAAKIETLNLQLHERTNSLKQAQKQIQQLQEQKPAPASPAAVQKSEEPAAKAAARETAPKASVPAVPSPDHGNPMVTVESSPLSAGSSKAHDSIRKLRDELAHRRNESQQSQEKLSRAANELESLQPVSAQPPAKKGIQQKLTFFGRRS